MCCRLGRFVPWAFSVALSCGHWGAVHPARADGSDVTQGSEVAEVAAKATQPAHDEAANELSSPEYARLVSDAIREYQLHHFAEARSLFSKAHSLVPSARTLRGLGAVEFELRNYGSTVSYLEGALASDIRPLTGELRERTERLLERARGFVARLELTVRPLSCLAVIDGVPVVQAREVVLEVGDHVLEFQAPGYIPEKRTVHVKGGEVQRLEIALSLRLEPMALHVDQPRPPLYKNKWLWSSVVVLAGAAAVGAGVALQHHNHQYDGGSTGLVLRP